MNGSLAVLKGEPCVCVYVGVGVSVGVGVGVGLSICLCHHFKMYVKLRSCSYCFPKCKFSF